MVTYNNMDSKKKRKIYKTENVTLVSPDNEQITISGTYEIEDAGEYNDEYLDLIFGNAYD